MRLQKGFSLTELLIALVVLITIAAIAIANLLRARMAANEAAAASSLRTVSTAMFEYQLAYPNIGYAAKLSNLGSGGVSPCPSTATAACLIDDVLASGIKQGYNVAAGGIPDPVTGVNTAYHAGAAPVAYDQTGVAAFCVTDDGVIRSDRNLGGRDTAGTSSATCKGWSSLGSASGTGVLAR